MTSDLPARLEVRLHRLPGRAVTEWSARPAAVLVPLLQEDSGWSLLYTLRTENVDEHRGQVSFPGGGIEASDADPIAAALREAQEEIGVRPGDVRVLGVMDTLLTVTQFEITPVVGVVPWPYALTLDPIEVAEAFSVPVSWLADAENLETRYREPMAGGPPIPVYYFRPIGGRTIWGASARITLSLLDLLGLRLGG